MKTTCPNCGVVLKAPEDALGRTAKCPKCAHAFRLPAPPLSAPGVDQAPPETVPLPPMSPPAASGTQGQLHPWDLSPNPLEASQRRKRMIILGGILLLGFLMPGLDPGGSTRREGDLRWTFPSFDDLAKAHSWREVVFVLGPGFGGIGVILAATCLCHPARGLVTCSLPILPMVLLAFDEGELTKFWFDPEVIVLFTLGMLGAMGSWLGHAPGGTGRARRRPMFSGLSAGVCACSFR